MIFIPLPFFCFFFLLGPSSTFLLLKGCCILEMNQISTWCDCSPRNSSMCFAILDATLWKDSQGAFLYVPVLDTKVPPGAGQTITCKHSTTFRYRHKTAQKCLSLSVKCPRDFLTSFFTLLTN